MKSLSIPAIRTLLFNNYYGYGCRAKLMDTNPSRWCFKLGNVRRSTRSPVYKSVQVILSSFGQRCAVVYS
ncbi:hypothetical protein Y032_0038g3606 [Ancylostoma ceylanicum]|uniref:Uncharacterized protein n=1 Tax=Ancylostoma ceylanicum TaxID=53326 RepID=A0A016UIT0_9BILA|nr:hypothetical protein Y032_0038g3606 [Ancylostoma ceylanicum]